MALQLRRGTNAERLLITPVQGEIIYVTDHVSAGVSPIWIGDGTTVGGLIGTVTALDQLSDVTLTTPLEGQTLYYDETTGQWRNNGQLTIQDTGFFPGSNSVSITNTGGLRVNSAGGITTNQTTFSLVNDTATTVNAFGAATNINIGSTANGSATSIRSTTLNINSSPANGERYSQLYFFGKNLSNVEGNSYLAYDAELDTLALYNTGGGFYFNNSVVISGDLTVQGTTTNIDTTNLAIEDNMVILNKNETGPGVTAGLAGFEIERGSLANVYIQWNETTDRWQTTVDGTNYVNIPNQNVDTDSSPTFTALNVGLTNILDVGSVAHITTDSSNLVLQPASYSTFVNGDLSVVSAGLGTGKIICNELDTGLTIFPLINDTATTIDFGGAATAINMGATGNSTFVNIRSNTLALGVSPANGERYSEIYFYGKDISNVEQNAFINYDAYNDSLSIGGALGGTYIGHDLIVNGDLQVVGNDIKSSSGGTAITLSNSNVKIGGDLELGTNQIYSSGAVSPAILTSSTNVQTGGDLTVGGNDIKSSGGTTALTLSGANVTVAGNLTVNGTTTTVNSTVVTIDDPIFTLGGDTAPTVDDGKDRGIEFRWYDTQARTGFFGFDRSTGKFTFIPDATNSSEVFSGTKGGFDIGNLTAGNVQIAVTGTNEIDTSSGNLTIDSAGGTTTIDDELIVSGDLRINGNEIKSSTGNTAITFFSDNTTIEGDLFVAGNGVYSQGGFQVFQFTQSNVEIVGDLTISGNDIKSFGGTTAITLNTLSPDVTIAGDLTVTGNDIIITHGAFTSDTLTTSATTADQVLLTAATASFRTVKATISITSGTAYQAVEILVMHDGTNAYFTTYADIRSGANLATFNADVSGGNLRLLTTPVNAVTTYKVVRHAVEV
jgi:hypothetical protein